MRNSFKKILTDHKSEEYHIARVADLFDILNQSRDYEKKKWLDKSQSEAFQKNAIHKLEKYEDQFAFIILVLAEFD